MFYTEYEEQLSSINILNLTRINDYSCSADTAIKLNINVDFEQWFCYVIFCNGYMQSMNHLHLAVWLLTQL